MKDRPRNDKPRFAPGHRRKLLATVEYELFSFLSKLTGAVFWWSEQRRWRIADQLEQLKIELQR
jgi:hypothetical protein